VVEEVMTRPYSEAFLIELFKRQDEEIGTRLAKACVTNKLPVTYVAPALGVTRMTVHSWFRGKVPKVDKLQLIEDFLVVVNKDATDGKLPAANLKQAKDYMASLTAIPT
jgi:hypothetical protein